MAAPIGGPYSAVTTRSTFVTTIAWIFIVIAGFATLMSAVQNLMIALVFPLDDMQNAMRQANKAHPLPWFAKFMFENVRILFATFLVLSATTLIAAIGLLRRKNWARILFVGIMGLGVLWNLGGLSVPYLMSSFPPLPPNTSSDFRDHFETMQRVIVVVSVIAAIAFAVLFGWIIKRLTSADIKREFSEV